MAVFGIPKLHEDDAHARQAGDERDELEALSWVPLMLCAGRRRPRSGCDAAARCR